MGNLKRVLVVDDNSDAVKIIGTWLNQQGLDVLTAEDGEAAIQKARSEALDCLVLDIMMPGLDGLQVCRELKSRPETRDLPVVILSVKKDEQTMEQASKLGVVSYLTKPVSPVKLMEAIRLHSRRNNPQKALVPAQAVFFIGSDSALIEKTQEILEHRQTGGKDWLRIMPVPDIKQATELLKTEKPKAIIADARGVIGELPSFCRHLKLNPEQKQLTVLVLLENAADDIKFAWANECLLPPIRPQRLADSLRRHIQRPVI